MSLPLRALALANKLTRELTSRVQKVYRDNRDEYERIIRKHVREQLELDM